MIESATMVSTGRTTGGVFLSRCELPEHALVFNDYSSACNMFVTGVRNNTIYPPKLQRLDKEETSLCKLLQNYD